MAFRHRHFPHIRLMRSCWFIPGNQEKKLNKMFTVPVWPDVFVPDLEDSVPYSEKKRALETLATFLDKHWRPLVQKYTGETSNTSLTTKRSRGQAVGLPLMLPRLNFTPELIYSEVKHLAQLADIIDGFVLGKVEQPLTQLDEVITEIEVSDNFEHPTGGRSLLLLPSIETPRGILNINNILQEGQPRVIGGAFGHDDYTTAMHTPTTECTEFALNQIAVNCIANSCFPIDSPFTSFKDTAGLEAAAKQAKGFGCKGKFAIHPAQIETLNKTFGVDPAQLEWALQAIVAFEEATKSGSAATSVNAKMVDIPVYKRAVAIKQAADYVNEVEGYRQKFLSQLQ